MCFLTGPCFKLKVGFIKMFLVILIYFWCAIKKVAFFLILNVLCFSASSKILNIFLPLCAPFLSIAVIPCYRRATKINYRLQTWTGIWLQKTSVKNKSLIFIPRIFLWYNIFFYLFKSEKVENIKTTWRNVI